MGVVWVCLSVDFLIDDCIVFFYCIGVIEFVVDGNEFFVWGVGDLIKILCGIIVDFLVE